MRFEFVSRFVCSIVFEIRIYYFQNHKFCSDLAADSARLAEAESRRMPIRVVSVVLAVPNDLEEQKPFIFRIESLE